MVTLSETASMFKPYLQTQTVSSQAEQPPRPLWLGDPDSKIR